MFHDALTVVFPTMFIFWGTFGDLAIPLFLGLPTPSCLAHWHTIGHILLLALMRVGRPLPIHPSLCLLLIAGPKGLSPKRHIIQVLDPYLAYDKLALWLNFGPHDKLSISHMDPLRQWLITSEISDVIGQVHCHS